MIKEMKSESKPCLFPCFPSIPLVVKRAHKASVRNVLEKVKCFVEAGGEGQLEGDWMQDDVRVINQP